MGSQVDYVAKKFGPLKSKTLQNALAHRINREFPRIGGPRIRQLCAEMILEVAHRKPELVARRAEAVAELLDLENTELVSVALQILVAIADRSQRVMGAYLRELKAILRMTVSDHDRDNVLRILGRYAAANRKAAEVVFALVKESLARPANPSRLAGLESLARVVAAAPHLRPQARALAEPFLKDPDDLVRKAAKGLLLAITGLEKIRA